MMKKLLYISMVLVWGFSSCYYDNEEELYPNSMVLSDTGTVSYAATIKPMINNNCATSGCHVAGATSPNLSTYEGVYNNRDLVKNRAVVGTPNWMPLDVPMPLSDRNLLGKWIDAGAPNN